jgi:hypothetical protein
MPAVDVGGQNESLLILANDLEELHAPGRG